MKVMPQAGRAGRYCQIWHQLRGVLTRDLHPMQQPAASISKSIHLSGALNPLTTVWCHQLSPCAALSRWWPSANPYQLDPNIPGKE